MLASTNRLVAGPLPPGPLLPEVERVTDAVFGGALPSLKPQTAVALAVKTPALLLLIVTVHDRVLPDPPGTQVVIESGVGETVTLNEVNDGVVPAGNAFVVIVNV